MKKILIDMENLSECKEVYGKRHNPWYSVFLYCLLGIVIISLVFSCIAKIDIVVSASGIISDGENETVITSDVSGKILSVNYYDGKEVKKGDVLLEIDVSEAERNLETLYETKENIDNQISLIDRYIEGLEKNENPFSSDKNGTEYSYYIDFCSYFLTKKQSESGDTSEREKIKTEIDSLKTQIENLENRKKGIESYKSSVECGKDMAKDFPVYENLYCVYENSVSVLRTEYENECDNVKSLYSDSSDEKNKALDKLKESYDSNVSQLKLKAISEADTLIQAVDSELATAKLNLNLYELSLEELDKTDNAEKNSTSESALFIQKSQELLTKKDNILSEQKSLLNQIEQAEMQVSNGKIKAECDGILKTNLLPKTGEMIASGTVVASILPQSESEKIVYLYLRNSDVAKVKEGDSIKFNISSLPSAEYGYAKGKVTKIYSEPVSNDNNYAGYYIAECSLENDELSNRNGSSIEIINGMQTEAKITVERKTVFRYLIEKLDFI